MTNIVQMKTGSEHAVPQAAISPIYHIGHSVPLKIVSDDHLQHLFMEKHKSRFRFDSSSKRWMVYEAGIWEHVTKAQVENDLQTFLRENLVSIIEEYGPPKDEKGNWTDAHYRLASRYSSPSGQAAVLRMAAYVSANHVSSFDFDRDRHLLNTPTFVIDLKTGKKELHTSERMMTRRTSVAPSGMEIPVFRTFLEDYTQGDSELALFLQRFFGLCLTGETREHKLLFLCGPGGNGKSVLLNVVREILGSYARMSNSTILMRGAESRHTTEVAELVGARMVTMSEVPADGMWSQQRLTSLTSGDTQTARFMYQDNFQFDPQFKLVLAGNHRPVIQTPDQAFLRRMLFLTSTFRPEVPDVALPEKLRREYGGILQWMIEGAVAYYEDGLDIPARISEATKDYAADEDDVGQWFDECCEAEEGGWVSIQELYTSYTEWAEDNGARDYKKRGLSERIVAFGYKREKRASKRGVLGLHLIRTAHPFTSLK